MIFKRKPKTTDKALIASLKKNGTERQKSENHLYDTYAYLVKTGIYKYKLTENDAIDAYTDSILATIQNIITGKFKEDSTIKTYLTKIFFRKCVDVIRKITTKKTETLSIDNFFNLNDTLRSTLESIILKEKVIALKEKIKLLSDKCQIIIEKWGMGYSDNEIAQIAVLGLSTATTVKTTRHRCLKKLRTL